MQLLVVHGQPSPRRAPISFAATATMLAVMLVGCGGGPSATASHQPSAPPSPSAAASASASELGVMSTLNGLTKLPHRIKWEATPSGFGNDVMEVDFLIDDQLAAVEHNPPYVYGMDNGWLVTSFLEPGAHTFVTKAIATDHRAALETVTATVAPSPEPPADLAGRWKRTVVGDDPGVWHVTINSIGWLFDDPHGGGQNQDASYPAPGKVMIGGAIVEPVLGEYDRDGAFCGEEGDPDGMFSYSVSQDGGRLTLMADATVCYQGLIQGTWARER